MNWMLVFFMGVSPHYQIVKTDLIFATESECFANEASRAKSTADKMNKIEKDLETVVPRDQVNRRLEFIYMQNPRGTCIPTMTNVTVKG
jgi:hypothetical protein